MRSIFRSVLCRSFALGGVIAAVALGVGSCSGGTPVGKSWTEKHNTGVGGVISSVTITVTALGPPSTLTVTTTGGATVAVNSGGTYNSATGTITVPAGTLTGSISVTNALGGAVGPKTLKFWDSFK